jgi:uncharacterized membrane protein YphA (DoxX/SURF4 family)
MNKVLWTMQALLGVFFSMSGFGKMVCYKPILWNQALYDVAWFSAVPRDLFIFIGVCEFLGGIGLILPAMTGVKPKLTAFAAMGLALVMIFAPVFTSPGASTTSCPRTWCWESAPHSSLMEGCL